MDTPGQAQTQHKQHKAPRALALHGAGAGGWEFNLWRWRFEAAGWDFHAPDLLPAEPLECTRLDDYLEQVEQHCAQLQPQLLIGASLGGLLALLAAADGPSLRRVLINPMPPAPWSAQLPGREWPARIQWAHRHDLAATTRALGACDPATRHYAQRRWRDESGAVLRQAHQGVALRGARLHTLVIAGAQDQDVPAAVSRALAAGIAADYLELADCGHVDPLFGAQTQGLIDEVLIWLRKSGLDAGTAA